MLKLARLVLFYVLLVLFIVRWNFFVNRFIVLLPINVSFVVLVKMLAFFSLLIGTHAVLTKFFQLGVVSLSLGSELLIGNPLLVCSFTPSLSGDVKDFFISLVWVDISKRWCWRPIVIVKIRITVIDEMIIILKVLLAVIDLRLVYQISFVIDSNFFLR